MQREDGEAVAAGRLVGATADKAALRRDYVWRDPARLNRQHYTPRLQKLLDAAKRADLDIPWPEPPPIPPCRRCSLRRSPVCAGTCGR